MKYVVARLVIAAAVACSSDAPQTAPSPAPSAPTPVAAPSTPKPAHRSRVDHEPPRPPPSGAVRVKRVVDGDTVVLEDGQRLRYVGIDTPEEFDHRKPVQCFAKEAADRNRALVEGKMVVIEKDVSEHDKYGRLIGFVYLLDGPLGQKGTLVNAKLVEEGYAFAWAYKPDVTRAEEFAAKERYAETRKLGLWKTCVITETKSHRKQTQAVSKRRKEGVLPKPSRPDSVQPVLQEDP